MKLTGSITEDEYRADLLNSKKYLFESEKGKHALNVIKEICGEIKTAYVLTHTPEQGEDIFRILVNAEQVIGFDLQDEAGHNEALNICIYSTDEYKRLLKGKKSRLMLATALKLSKDDL